MSARRSPQSSRRLQLALGAVALSFGLTAIAAIAPGCSSTSSSSTPPVDCSDTAGALTCTAATCAMPGMATAGPADSHCGTTNQPTSQAACNWDGGGVDPGATSGGGGATTSGAGGAGGATGAGGAAAGGGGAGAGGGDMSDYGPTEYGNESDDDDCKYHVTWTSTPICENGGVTFTVKATNRSDGTPLTGAAPYPEVYLDTTHTSPNGPCACKTSTTTESTPGTYTIGPVFFDAPGKWTVRFHFFGTCTDFSDSSPHGHAAYYLTVP